MSIWAIVVAAGNGTRFGGPKQFAELGGRRIVEWAVAVARETCDGIVLVVPPGTPDELVNASVDCVVAGGGTRAISVRAGLEAVPEDAHIVVVHDAARPLATAALFESVIAAVRGGADGAVPGLAVVDTIKRVDEALVVRETLDRSNLLAVQTPQAFKASVLRAAHAGQEDATDDAALVEAAGGRVVAVPGEEANRKITVGEDLVQAQAMMLR